MPDPARRPDAGGLAADELDRARRELGASLALARLVGAGAVRGAERRARGQPVIYLCSCGSGTYDPGWLDGHLVEHRGPGRRSGTSEVAP